MSIASRYTNAPIAVNVYNGRSIVTNRAVTKNCIRQADGTLWAVLGHWGSNLAIWRSTDNGFSWQQVLPDAESGSNMRNESGFNCDGPFAYLVIDERWRNLDLYMGEWNYLGSEGSLERKRWDLDDITETATNTTVLYNSDDNYQGGSFDIAHNFEQVFLTWVRSTGILYVTRCSPRSSSVSSDLALGSPTLHMGMLSSVVDKDGNLHIASTHLDGSSHRVLVYIPYNSQTPSFGTPVEIEDMGASPAISNDVSIAIDGLGTLCVVYFDQGDEEVRYAISTDDGANWDVNTLTRTSGHAVYEDAITSDKAGRTNCIGGSQGGFLMSYVEDNSSGTPRTYIRQITTSDAGSTYDLGDEKEIANYAPWDDQAITGLQFFHPTDVKLLDLSDPGSVRVAYQVGEGNDEEMYDSEPVTVGQELLSMSAYPSASTDTHTLDTADANSLLVSMYIGSGPSENIDFYDLDFTGDYTDKFMAAFDRMGTDHTLKKYEPLASNFMNDRTGYQDPTVSSAKIILSPQSYSFPTPSITADGVEDWVERDVRRIYLAPDTHISRNFLVNKGGYLKRTVWTVEFDGNEYEISQVVPRFLSNQICYYEANAYVIGPSRDPFSRTILPSET